MTTIAYKDRTMAADRQMTRGGSITGSHLKVFRAEVSPFDPSIGAVYATAGISCEAELMRHWAEMGFPLGGNPKLTMDDTSTLLIDDDGNAFIYDGPGPWAPLDMIDGCCAIGHGRNEAMGAMLAGATALESVQIAARLDVYTGAPFDEVPLGPSSAELTAKAERDAFPPSEQRRDAAGLVPGSFDQWFKKCRHNMCEARRPDEVIVTTNWTGDEIRAAQDIERMAADIRKLPPMVLETD